MTEKLKCFLIDFFNCIYHFVFAYLSFWWFAYAYEGITDYRDADAEFTNSIGWMMLIFGVVVIILSELCIAYKSKNRKRYLLISIPVYFISLFIMYFFIMYLPYH